MRVFLSLSGIQINNISNWGYQQTNYFQAENISKLVTLKSGIFSINNFKFKLRFSWKCFQLRMFIKIYSLLENIFKLKGTFKLKISSAVICKFKLLFSWKMFPVENVNQNLFIYIWVTWIFELLLNFECFQVSYFQLTEDLGYISKKLILSWEYIQIQVSFELSFIFN